MRMGKIGSIIKKLEEFSIPENKDLLLRYEKVMHTQEDIRKLRRVKILTHFFQLQT